MRPTSPMLRVQPFAKWNEYDHLLFEAYTILQSERCGQCGLPVWICHNTDSQLQFRTIKDVCLAVRDMKRSENPTAEKAVKDMYGVANRPEPYTIGDLPIDWAMRDSYYKEKAEFESRAIRS